MYTVTPNSHDPFSVPYSSLHHHLFVHHHHGMPLIPIYQEPEIDAIKGRVVLHIDTQHFLIHREASYNNKII